MPIRQFALEPGGPLRLAVRIEGEVVDLAFDGARLGGFRSDMEADAGRTFLLPDGSSLHVERFAPAKLHILRNGVPVPGSDGDFATRARSVANWVMFSGVTVTFAALPTMKGESLAGVALVRALSGLVVFALGLLVRSKGSQTAQRCADLLWLAAFVPGARDRDVTAVDVAVFVLIASVVIGRWNLLAPPTPVRGRVA
jgi:hypothetical protein